MKQWIGDKLNSNLEPQLFSQIMDLPQQVRLDLLSFLGSVAVAHEEIQRIVDELSASQLGAVKVLRAS